MQIWISSTPSTSGIFLPSTTSPPSASLMSNLPGHLQKRLEPKTPKHPLAKLKKQYGGLNAYARHKQLINNYQLYYPSDKEKLLAKNSASTSGSTSAYDVLKKSHKFLWDADDITEAERSWDAKLAKRYYDKLFKEYCIADLSHYQKNRVAMRWRIEREVKAGKGQFICGEKRCSVDQRLESWEVNFAYEEQGEKKNALVKLRLCPECSLKLNFHSQKKKAVKKAKKEKESRKRRKHEAKSKQKPKGSETTVAAVIRAAIRRTKTHLNQQSQCHLHPQKTKRNSKQKLRNLPKKRLPSGPKTLSMKKKGIGSCWISFWTICCFDFNV